MKKRKLTNMPASVHHRLLNLARETKRPFNELLQYYTMEWSGSCSGSAPLNTQTGLC
jgi:hypothetical protein